MKSGLEEAAEKLGSKAQLAKALRLTRSAISQWRNGPPPERCIEIERLTGVSRHRLRPDVFGKQPGPLVRESCIGVHSTTG